MILGSAAVVFCGKLCLQPLLDLLANIVIIPMKRMILILDAVIYKTNLVLNIVRLQKQQAAAVTRLLQTLLFHCLSPSFEWLLVLIDSSS